MQYVSLSYLYDLWIVGETGPTGNWCRNGENMQTPLYISTIQKPMSTTNLNQYVSGSVYTYIPWLLHIWITAIQKTVQDIKIDNRMIDLYARAVASITPFSQQWEEIVSSPLNIHRLSKDLWRTHNVLMIHD